MVRSTGNLSSNNIMSIGQQYCPAVEQIPHHATPQVSLSCAILCQIGSLQYLSRSSLHRLSVLSSFLAVWSPSGDTKSPSVVFEVVDVKCPGPHFSHIADYVDDYYSLP